jgi:hypothetical protein
MPPARAAERRRRVGACAASGGRSDREQATPAVRLLLILRDVANALDGGWSTDIARLHLRKNVQCADEKLAAQIAEAPAPFWRHVRDTLAEGIIRNPRPPFRKRPGSVPG